MSEEQAGGSDTGEAGSTIDDDPDSFDEEIADYPEGFAGIQKAYADIQSIFETVAKEYPQWFFGSDDEEGPQGQSSSLPGMGDHKKSLRFRETDEKVNDPCETKQEPVVRTLVGGDMSSDVALPEMDVMVPITSSLANRPGTAPAKASLSKTLKPGLRPELVIQSPASVSGQMSAHPIGHSSQLAEAGTSIYSRTKSLEVSEVRHDEFAEAFIRSSAGQEMERSFLENFQKKQLLLSSLGPDGTTFEPTDDVDHVPRYEDQNSKGSSLKLIYNPPVWPHQESLYKTLSRLPALRCLVLDDSKIHWLRDLGSRLPNLKTLSIMRCNLTSLDGALGLPNLETLFATDNCIADPSPLSTCTNLRYVDLSDNQISDLTGFTLLKDCRALTCLKLMENSVAQRPNFHVEMRRLIPSLRDLRPRILEIHGPSVFDLYEETDAKVSYSRSVTRESHGTVASGDEDYGMALSTTWIGEEQRLRDVYNPGRTGYKKRAMTSIPYTVDEMDALLEELELSVSGKPSAVDLPAVDKFFSKENSELTTIVAPVEVEVPGVVRIPSKIRSASKKKRTRAKTAAVHFQTQQH